MEQFVCHLWNKEIVIDEDGQIVSGEVVGRVLSYTVERADNYFFRKNEKTYATFKEAYKALIRKAKQHPGQTYVLRFRFENRIQYGQDYTHNLLYAQKKTNEPQIEVTFSYERMPFAHIDTEKETVDVTYPGMEENQLLQVWLPKERKRKATALQQEIQSFRPFGIERIDCKKLQGEEKRTLFFNELRHCVHQMNHVFPISDYYPIKRIYFSPFKKYRGIYREQEIAFQPTIIQTIRSTAYHEYGHHIYEGGLYQFGGHRYQGNPIREENQDRMDELIALLSQEKTLKEIWENAEYRMKRFPSPKKPHLHQYLSEREEYLVRPTEIFARLFESYLLDKDHQAGESLSYQLKFTKEELRKAEPLFQDFLTHAHDLYKMSCEQHGMVRFS